MINYSAGAVAIAKCAKLPQLGSGDSCKLATLEFERHVEANRLRDNEVELYIWDVTESTVAVMAACIPTLRVLVRGMKPPPETDIQLADMSFSFDWTGDRGSKEVIVARQVTNS
jgi:hypothetical protein